MAKILTQRGVETAKPKAKRYGLPDGIIPGMQLIIQPTGSKSYTLLPRLRGKQISLRLGAAGVLTLAQARDLARSHLGTIASGKDPRVVKQATGAAVAETFAAVAQQFVERYAKPNNKKWRETARVLEVDVLPHWRHRPIDSIAKADVISLLDGIVDRGSSIQANRTLAMVRKLFNWGVERGVLDVAPTDRVRKPAKEVARDRVLDDRELALVSVATGTLGYPAGPMIQLLMLSAQRRCEVSDMTWNELDPNMTLWTLPRERVKNNEPHHLPISTMMRDVLRGLPRVASPGGFVFTNGKVAVAGFSKIKCRLDAAITGLNGGTPLAPWTFHDLRRSAATGMARLGVQLPVVEKVLNHTSGSFGGVAGIYQRHDFRDEMREALERWGRYVAAIQLETELRRGFAGR